MTLAIIQSQKKVYCLHEIDHQGVSNIAYALQYNKALYDVNLSQTQIGTEGCNQIISALLKNPKSVIYRLDLRHDGVNEPQISNLLKFAKQNRSLCFVEIYPSKDKEQLIAEAQKEKSEKGIYPSSEEVLEKNDTNENKSQQEERDDGWLTYSGWVTYGELRSQLNSNLEYRKKNPHIFKSKNNEDVIGDYIQYIMYNLGAITDDTFSKLIADEKTPQKPSKRPISFEKWKKNRKLQSEWQQLTIEQSRLLQLEKKLQEQHKTSSSNIYKNLVLENSGMISKLYRY